MGQNFGQIPWGFDFGNFSRILKLRGLYEYAWAYSKINQHFEIVFIMIY